MRSPRLPIPMTPEIRALYQRNADRCGMTLTQFVSMWLTMSAEGTDWVAEQVQIAKEAPAKFVASMGKLASLSSLSTDELLDGLDKVATTTTSTATGRREAGGVVATLFPPSSNTGVNSPTLNRENDKTTTV